MTRFIDNAKYALVFFGIAFVFIYYLGFGGLKEQELRGQWPKLQGLITKSEVIAGSHLEGSAHYDLMIEFEVDLGGKIKKYRAKKLNGTHRQTNKMLRTTYSEGANIELYINPKNPNEYLFEVHHSWGPYLVGFLPGIVLILIGLSVLLSKSGGEPSGKSPA